MLTLTLLVLLSIALGALVTGRRPDDAGGAVARWLDSRSIVGLVFAVTAGVLLFAWAGMWRWPNVHDEAAYAFQAQVFATGRWALPSPAMPLFHEQPYFLVEPVLASKYFPGHSLLLVPGALVGWLPLMPLVLQGIAGCLVFVLVRRVANGALALFTWSFWLTTPIVLHFGPTYFSQATTIVCWLAGWYALLEWHRTRRLAWLLGVALATGWCVITRPLTGLAYAIPVGLVVCTAVVRERRWRDLGLALAAGMLVLAIIPLWSARTTGDWRVTPLERYTRDYMPYDLPGFGLDSTPPARGLNPQFVNLNHVFRQWHPGHTPANLPGILLERAQYLSWYVWGWSRGLLALFAIVGLVTLRGPALFAVASSVFLLLVYLSFGTPPTWALYYYESVPAYAYLTAAGIAWAAALVGGGRRAEPRAGWASRRWTLALVAGVLVFLYPRYLMVRMVSYQRPKPMANYLNFERARQSIPGRALLFVRYAPWHTPHETFVRNVVDPARERVITVHDRGDAENARLAASMPDRTPWMLDEARGARYPYRPAPRP